ASTTPLYPVSLHDALPICFVIIRWVVLPASKGGKIKTVLQTAAIALMLLSVPALDWFPAISLAWTVLAWLAMAAAIIVTLVTGRSEEHTSELQSRFDLVCR